MAAKRSQSEEQIVIGRQGSTFPPAPRPDPDAWPCGPGARRRTLPGRPRWQGPRRRPRGASRRGRPDTPAPESGCSPSRGSDPAGRPCKRSGSPPRERPRRIWRLPAPIAFSRPTSRVRSETETSIRFMIPIPATASETAAMPPRASVSAVRIEEREETTDSWVMQVTSSSPWRSVRMATAREQAASTSWWAPTPSATRNSEVRLKICIAVATGYDDEIVHVEAHLLPAALQHADHAHPPVAHPHRAADRRLAPEELVGNRGAEDDHLGAPLQVAGRQRTAPRDLQLADLQKLPGGTQHHHLTASLAMGDRLVPHRHGSDQVDLRDARAAAPSRRRASDRWEPRPCPERSPSSRSFPEGSPGNCCRGSRTDRSRNAAPLRRGR